MLTVATLLWAANRNSLSFSTMYDEGWVERLYRGFRRNLTRPFRFVCYSDRERAFAEPIELRPLADAAPTYGACIQPFEMDCPMILTGLDTIVCGNVDALADYALSADVLAVPRDPYAPHQACNGVALIPAGHAFVWTAWDRRGSDMDRVRAVEHRFIDDLFPRQVVSFKGHVEPQGLGDARIVYFHGDRKPHQLAGHPLVQEHWR